MKDYHQTSSSLIHTALRKSKAANKQNKKTATKRLAKRARGSRPPFWVSCWLQDMRLRRWLRVPPWTQAIV